MNSLGILILTLVVVVFIWEQFLSYINLRYSHSQTAPQELEMDTQRYQKSLEYLEANTKFGIVSASFGLAVFLAFWLLGGFPWLDTLVRSFAYGSVSTGMLFIGALGLGQTLLGLPFKIYRTFVLEEKFGFNRTSVKTFCLDLVKGLLLSLLIGAPLLAAVLWFFSFSGDKAWLYVWTVTSLFQLIILFIAPVWLMPLFFKFTPLAEGTLKNQIENYAKKVNFKLSGIFVIDGSKRSSKSNAFFTGFGKTKRIALFDTLLEKSTEGEIVSVLAHEVGHAKHGHVWKGIVLSLMSSGIMFYIMNRLLAWNDLYLAFYIEQASVYSGLVFLSILYGPIGNVLGILTSYISRRHEYQADAFAAKTADPKDMISALKKLSETNLSNPNPHPWVVAYEYSHPTTVQRIRALMA